MVATGQMAEAEAAEVWGEDIWRPGELAVLVSHLIS